MTSFSPFWNPLVQTLSPYIPGEQSLAVIKLNTNENPFPPSPLVWQAIEQAQHRIRLYPAPESDRLTDALAQYHRVLEKEIFVGNGSDEVLAHAFLALLKHEKPLIFPDITYSFYPVYAQLYDIPTQSIALEKNFTLSVEKIIEKQPGAVIFPNPNAPTGLLLAKEAICHLCTQLPHTPIVIDEAYIDFAQEEASVLPWVATFPNLLVVRTFSKSRAMAGLRLGYAVGQAHLIEALKRVKNSFNSYPINVLTEAAGVASLSDEAYFQQKRQEIIRNRHFLTHALEQLHFCVYPSAANFIWATHRTIQATTLLQHLKSKRILVRHFAHPARIANYLRITIGTEEECQSFIRVLAEFLGESQ